jgi:aspartyl-tRNA synthetase
VKETVERIIRKIWKEAEGIDLPEIFKVMTYNEAMSKVRIPHCVLRVLHLTRFSNSTARISLI